MPTLRIKVPRTAMKPALLLRERDMLAGGMLILYDIEAPIFRTFREVPSADQLVACERLTPGPKRSFSSEPSRRNQQRSTTSQVSTCFTSPT